MPKNMENMREGKSKDLAKSSTFLEDIPIIGGLFKAARKNVEGTGPGTNKMDTPASDLKGDWGLSSKDKLKKGKSSSDTLR